MNIIKGIIGFTVFVVCLSASAQDFECGEPKKKAKKLFKKLEADAGLSNNERMAKLNEIRKIDPDFIEVLDELAFIYERKANTYALDPKTYTKSLQFESLKIKLWQEISAKCPEFAGGIYKYKLGKYFFNKKEYNNARPYLEYFVKNGKGADEMMGDAKLMLRGVRAYEKIMSTEVPFNPVKLEGGANSGWDEYLPMLSPDNRYLYFTRKKTLETKSTFDRVKEFELLTESRRMGKNRFSSGLDMPERLNIGQYQGGVSISVDNKLMFMTVVNMVKMKDGRGFANGDIYYTEKKDGAWTDLKSIGDNINGKLTWEGQPCISSDNKVLYFASAREPGVNGHIGGMDIYKSIRQDDGSWGDPINLGDSINTPFDEKSPFMHADSYTLYFSSNGHVGVGGFDIFYSKQNEAGEFYYPVNLGHPINTEKDEHGFIVSTDGKYGYFSSNLEGKSLDIYSFELYEQARPKKVLFVQGSMKTASGKVPEDVKIELKSTNSKRVREGVVDKETGEYVAVVAVDKDEDVLLTAKKKGYAFSSQLVSSGGTVIGKPQRRPEMELKKIEKGEKYRINDINFATNSYELNDDDKFILDEFVDFLKTNPTVRIAIHGHTDNVGDPEENLELSKNRAKEVYDYLVSKGISADRLTHDGFGETQPLASNDTAEGRAKNRRTEFVILNK